MEPNPEARLCNKQLAARLGVSVRTLKRRSKLVGIRPTFPLHSREGWSEADAAKLERRWQRLLKQSAAPFADAQKRYVQNSIAQPGPNGRGRPSAGPLETLTGPPSKPSAAPSRPLSRQALTSAAPGR